MAMLSYHDFPVSNNEKQSIFQDIQVNLIYNASKFQGTLSFGFYRIRFTATEHPTPSTIKLLDIYYASILFIRLLDSSQDTYPFDPSHLNDKPSSSSSSSTAMKKCFQLTTSVFQDLTFSLISKNAKIKSLMNLVLKQRDHISNKPGFHVASLTAHLPSKQPSDLAAIQAINDYQEKPHWTKHNQEFKFVLLNKNFQLTHYYSTMLVIPNSLNENMALPASKSHELGQFELVTWINTSGTLLLRSLVHLNDRPTSQSLSWIRAHVLKCPNKSLKVIDVGARRVLNLPDEYQYLRPEYLDLPNNTQIFNIYSSELVESVLLNDNECKYSNLRNWINLIKSTLKSTALIASHLRNNQSILVQGNKKNMIHFPILTLVQMICDPAYRTLRGFGNLIHKDWTCFSFPFQEHLRSTSIMLPYPYFELLIHLVWMLYQIYPTQFGFNEKLIYFLMSAIYTGKYATFSFNNQRSARKHLSVLPSIQNVMENLQDEFYNNHYDPVMEYLDIEPFVEHPILWRDFFTSSKLLTLFDYASIEDEIRSITNRQYYLSPNYRQISAIPPALSSLMPNLKILHLKGANLTHLPFEVKNFPSLENLSFSGNPILYVPYDWLRVIGKSLTFLKHLDLDRSMVMTFPINIHIYIPSLFLFTLNHLNLEQGHSLEIEDDICMSLDKIEDIANLTLHRSPRGHQFDPHLVHQVTQSHLQNIELVDNHLFQIPSSFINMMTVSTLDLSNNRFTDIPHELNGMKNLKEINLSYNVISQLVLPSLDGYEFPSLKCLNISNNQLESLPNHLGYFPSIYRVCFDHNLIKRIPDGILSDLSNVTIFTISYNKLDLLPESIGYLKNLFQLAVHHNAIKLMPDRLCQLRSLSKLDVSNNDLRQINLSIGQLKSLTSLKISNNALTVLPPQLGFLKSSLTNFEYDGNELVTPPREIIQQGPFGILEFLYDSLSGTKRIYRMKLMIVGQENVGKTTIVQQLGRLWEQGSNAKANVEPTPTLSTDGIVISRSLFPLPLEYKKDEVSTQIMPSTQSTPNTRKLKTPVVGGSGDQQMVEVDWWDYAGQELYHTTHLFFLSARTIFLLIWNLELPINQSHIEFWLNSIQSKVSTASVMLIGTHMDSLKSSRLANLDQELNEIKIHFRDLFPTLTFSIMAISPRTGENMSDLKLAIERKILQSKYMGEALPISYLLLEQMTIEQRSLRRMPVISWNEFKKHSLICNINDERELSRAANFLHHLGTLVYFDRDIALSHYVIIDPQWLAKLMSTLVTTKHSFAVSGIITNRALIHLWREFPSQIFQFLLELLQKFELSYDITTYLDLDQCTDSDSIVTSGDLLIEGWIQMSKDSTSAKSLKRIVKSAFRKKTKKTQTPTTPVNCKLEKNMRTSNNNLHYIVANETKIKNEDLTTFQPILNPTIAPTSPFSTHLNYCDSIKVTSNNISSPSTQNIGFQKGLVSHRQIAKSQKYPASDVLYLMNHPLELNQIRLNGTFPPAFFPSPSTSSDLEFNIRGVNLIPSMLPQARPIFKDPANDPDLLPPNDQLECNRLYLFSFLPSGLFSRLMVRLLQQFMGHHYDFVTWNRGLLLVGKEHKIMVTLCQEKTQTLEEKEHLLQILVRSTQFCQLAQVFCQVLETTGILFKEYPDLKVSQFVMCPMCRKLSTIDQQPLDCSGNNSGNVIHEDPILRCRVDGSESYLIQMESTNPVTNLDKKQLQLVPQSSTHAIYRFPVQTLVQYVQRDTEAISCQSNGHLIRLEHLVPDIKLVYWTGPTIKFSNLQLEKEIGEGGFAIVYKGHYQGKEVAIKLLTVRGPGQDLEDIGHPQEELSQQMIDPSIVYDPSPENEKLVKAFNEFRKEAFMMMQIDEPHCLSLVGLCLQPFCLVSDFVSCGDLYQLCNNTDLNLDWDLRLKIALDIANGMAYLHSKRPEIIHNDLKSPNILLVSLDPKSEVCAKISDFGLSEQTSRMYMRLVDNPVWTAPEILRGQIYDCKADVYAYGVMLWEMLERSGFFGDLSFNSEVEMHVLAKERPKIAQPCLPEYYHLLRICWDDDPGNRPTFDKIVIMLKWLTIAYQEGKTTPMVCRTRELPTQEGKEGKLEEWKEVEISTVIGFEEGNDGIHNIEGKSKESKSQLHEWIKTRHKVGSTFQLPIPSPSSGNQMNQSSNTKNKQNQKNQSNQRFDHGNANMLRISLNPNFNQPIHSKRPIINRRLTGNSITRQQVRERPFLKGKDLITGEIAVI